MSRRFYTDSQRAKLYKAEREAFAGDAEYITPDEALELVSKVWALSPGLLSAPGVRFSRKKNFGAAHYTGWCHEITFHTDSIKAWVVVHEVAHAVERKGAAHGPEFARAYLGLVERTFGFEARERLGASFRKHKVRSHGKSRAKQKSTGPKPETKREKAEKLAKAAGLKIREMWDRHYYELEDDNGKLGRDGWTHNFYGLDEVISFIEKSYEGKVAA